MFRDEEAIITDAQAQGKDLRQTYREDIMPYKGAVELWYNDHGTMLIDLKIIFLTAYAIFAPGNGLLQRWFSTLPEPESELVRKHAGFASDSSASVERM